MTTEEITLAEAENQQTTEDQTSQSDQVTAENAEPETQDTPETTAAENADTDYAEEEPPRKTRAQERIQQLVQQRKEAEDKAAELEAKLASYEAPEVKDAYEYETDQDYHRELAKSIAAETQNEIRETAAREAREAAARASEQAFLTRVEEAKATIPDIQQSIQAVGSMVSADAADMIISSDHSIELVNFLAKNPLEAQRLKTMSPIQAARTIGQLETRVQRPATKKISTAPAPVKTVSGNSGNAGKSLDEMSHAEYVAYRKKQGINRIG